MVDFSGIGLQIFNWYELNRRDLPWRRTKDPYKIWISEIVLQQTRIIQGIDYYRKIIEAFPTVYDMANADSELIMKLWQGLGYYSRARNMHFASKQIAFELNGQFPDKYIKILKLKGVGKYTAAAIASISFEEKVPVVDGNVYRLLARYFGVFTQIGSNKAYSEFFDFAYKLLANHDPAIINQGMMELGAVVCLPQNPNCDVCPISAKCFARLNNCIGELPVKGKQVKVRNRYLNYLVLESDTKIMVKKRDENDIWKELYDFPLIETDNEIDVEELLQLSEIIKMEELNEQNFVSSSKSYFHKLTHQNIYAKFFRFDVNKFPNLNNCKVEYLTEIHKLAVPRLIDKYLNHEFDFQK